MKRAWLARIMTIVVLLSLQAVFIPPMYAEPTSFNDPNMKIVWERTDKPVETFVTQRSYMWGPNTLPGSPSTEPYANSPGGNRTVQYFDKSRMEVNDPNGDRSNLFFITNGLLVREMVGGQLQLGDTQFEARTPATEAVAGDPSTAGNAGSPTYATFKNIASLDNDHPSTDKTGRAVVEAIDKAGNVTSITSPDASVVYAAFNQGLKHNRPNKFVDFLNQTGPVWVNGQIGQDTVINGVFLAGFPVTEAYWVKAKVAGVEKDVLVQLFERRVLTYTPSNPAGFQVEMGNVGQHYLRWRYGGSQQPEQRIIFTSGRAGFSQVFTMKTDGSDVKQLTTAGSNFGPKWSPDNRFIAFTSERDGNREIYVMNADGSNQRRLTVTPAVDEEIPNWSPDGSRLYFERASATGLNIWSMTSDGGDQKQLTNTPGFFNIVPVASPDGQKVAFQTNRDGNQEVYVMNVDGSQQTRLTIRTGTNNGPTDWKDNKILFHSFGDAIGIQIWTMNSDGGAQTKISGDFDRKGSYSPDMRRIVFTRLESFQTQTGNIWVMNSDGTGLQNLTNNTGIFNDDADWSN